MFVKTFEKYNSETLVFFDYAIGYEVHELRDPIIASYGVAHGGRRVHQWESITSTNSMGRRFSVGTAPQFANSGSI
jgi:hypothetical protein